MTEVWSQKYRPNKLEDMVGQHQLLGEFDSLLDDDYNSIKPKYVMQHYLFYSPEAGVGKTTLARIIAEKLGMQLFSYNASTKHERGIDFVENELLPMSRNGNYRQIYLLDEADQLTPAAQSALKGVIENAQGYFILTCNDLSKVSRWLQSRCRTLRFEPIPEDEMVERLSYIAAHENVDVRLADLHTIAKAHKGDLRNSINALQAFAGLTPRDGDRFLLSLKPQEIDANSFLKSCVAESDYEKAMTYIGDRPIRQTINSIFSYAVNSNNAKPAAKMRIIEAAVQSERDLLIGVDEDIVKHNFVVMCCDTSQLYTGENAERITKQGVLL